MDVNLVLFKKNGSRKSFTLPSSVTVIGRRSDCDLYAPLTSVSKRHCQLHCDQGILKIRDLGSRNGTYLNGKRINEAVIQAGDHIKVGPLTFALQIDGQPENVDTSKPTGQHSPERNASPEDSTADEFDSFADVDLESLEED
ncbi:MAG: FHA domain-containing protein [Planctomycetota bacterium]|jgi:pSer/pThr/pTyr-binding forkhead associated (FHA) protein